MMAKDLLQRSYQSISEHLSNVVVCVCVQLCASNSLSVSLESCFFLQMIQTAKSMRPKLQIRGSLQVCYSPTAYSDQFHLLFPKNSSFQLLHITHISLTRFKPSGGLFGIGCHTGTYFSFTSFDSTQTFALLRSSLM
jgi:hypothetical protein